MAEEVKFYFIVPNRDTTQITNINDVLDLIETALDNLANTSSTTDLNIISERKNFLANVNFLQRFYERLERLTLDEKYAK
jgi:hypothetical protein